MRLPGVVHRPLQRPKRAVDEQVFREVWQPSDDLVPVHKHDLADEPPDEPFGRFEPPGIGSERVKYRLQLTRQRRDSRYTAPRVLQELVVSPGPVDDIVDEPAKKEPISPGRLLSVCR